LDSQFDDVMGDGAARCVPGNQSWYGLAFRGSVGGAGGKGQRGGEIADSYCHWAVLQSQVWCWRFYYSVRHCRSSPFLRSRCARGQHGNILLVRRRRPRWVRMQVGFRDYNPPFMRRADCRPRALFSNGHSTSRNARDCPPYLCVRLLAWVVYQKVGLAILRKAWLNCELMWAGALAVAGSATLLM